MKKLITLLIITLMFSQEAFCLSYEVVNSPKKSKFSAYIAKKRDEFSKKREQNREISEIKKLLKDLTKYSNEHDVKNIISLYDKSYRSFDGFDYDTFVKMLEETFDSYKNISYESHIKNIELNADRAIVSLVDYTRADLSAPDSEKIKNNPMKDGFLFGECNYAIYLQKINNEWKIVGDNVISEVTSVRYGDARKYDMDFSAPLSVPKNSEYCLTLKTTPKKGQKIVASLGKAEILYPSVEPEDIFRKLPSDGVLERIVRSNKSGYNEYAIASVGITKIDVIEDFSAIRFQMTGLAFLMQRVNLYTPLNPVREKKEEKKDVENKG